MLTYIGQFFDHDIDLTKGADPAESADFDVPQGDVVYDPEDVSTGANVVKFPFSRSNYVVVDGVREQVNSITAYIDGSVVYGETPEKADNLRSHRDGKLLTYDSDMLPFATNEMNVAMAADSGKETVVRAAGDFRGNVNPPILALQTLFLREHNRLATEMKEANPDWDDEKIYQEARKWNSAYMQSICFYEYIPMLGIQLEAYSGYKPTIDASVDNFFSTVSYRYGHSEVGDIIFRLDDNGNEISEGHVPLFEAFFYPTFALNAGIDPILRGLAWRHQMEVDAHFSSAIQDFLFGDPGNGGSDLTARNIQRGRDHGIPDYNTCRQAMGLSKKKSFSEITAESFTAVKLGEIYDSVDDVDAYIGGLAEDHVNGSNLGELFYTSLKDQYTRIRDGDRFYFENKDNLLFTDSEISQIRSIGLRDIIMRNTNIKRLPDNVYFRMPGDMWPAT
eukprot:g3027.t1